jgi:PleD family two-component response regulator
MSTGPRGMLRITCSFGVALSNPQDVDWKGIDSRGDTALYDAKAQGKDRVIFGRSYVKGATGRFRSLRIVPSRP